MFSSKRCSMERVNCSRSLGEATFPLCFTEELPAEREKNMGVLEANGEMEGGWCFSGRGLDMKRQGIEFNKY